MHAEFGTALLLLKFITILLWIIIELTFMPCIKLNHKARNGGLPKTFSSIGRDHMGACFELIFSLPYNSKVYVSIHVVQGISPVSYTHLRAHET